MWQGVTYDLKSVVHALLNSFPYFFLALYPFRKHLRLPPPPSIFFICALAGWEVIFDAIVSTLHIPHTGWLFIINFALCAVVYILLVKENWRKAVFTLTVLTNIASIISHLSVFLEHLIFPYHVVKALNGWTFSFCTVLIECAILIPLWLYLKKIFSPVISLSKPLLWRYLWLVPCFLYSIWYYTVYIASGFSKYDMAIISGTAIFNLVYLASVLLIYHVIIMQVRVEGEKLTLLEEAHGAQIQQMQYLSLMKHIKETRIARHDLKHHLLAMDSMIKDGQYDKLNEYFENYRNSLDFDTPLSFCDDHTANLIISYYAEQSKREGIAFEASVKVPGQIPLERSDLGALLGNLLSNALEACSNAQGEEKLIKIVIAVHGGSTLLLSVKNSTDSETLKMEDGEYISTKHEGYGTGSVSIRRIAEKHGGSVRFSVECGMFSAYVLLYCKESDD